MIVALALATALAGNTVVSQVCPGSPVGDTCGAGSPASNAPSSAGYIGDPVSIGAGHTLHSVVDFTVATPSGPLEFRRFYVSTHETWGYAHMAEGSKQNGKGFIASHHPAPGVGVSTPTPFGTGLYPYSLYWWHNFYSMVMVHQGSSGDVWRYVDRQGRTSSFIPCSSVGCEAPPSDMYEGTQAVLRKTAAGFEVLNTQGERLVYESLRNEAQAKYYLTRMYRMSGALAFEVEYGEPMDASGDPIGSNCPETPAGSASFVPYIRSIWTSGNANSGGERLVFYYEHMQYEHGGDAYNECAISRVDVEVEGRPVQTLASYGYEHRDHNNDMVKHPGFPYSGGDEFYTYPDALGFASGSSALRVYRRASAGARRLRFAHSYGGTDQVVGVDTVDDDFNLSWPLDAGVDAGGCSSGVVCCGSPVYLNVVPVEFGSAGMGDGGTASPQFVRRYTTEMAENGIRHETRVRKVADLCTQPASCAQGTFDFQYDCAVPGELQGVRNKRGAWTVYERQPAPADAGVPARINELKTVKIGATTSSGAGLEEVSFAYSYGPDRKQVPVVEERVSLLAPTTETDRFARTRTFYAAGFSRLSKTIKSGWTLQRTGPGAWSPVRKYIGTFYFNKLTGASSPDPLNRIVEVHGPCFVSSDSATGCSEAIYPVTQFEHYPSSASLPERNRLHKVKRFPKGLASSPLVTEVLSYNVLGMPTRYKDAAGTETSLEWLDQRLSSVTRGASQWQLFYDGDHLTEVRYPGGGREVICRRSGAYMPVCNWLGGSATTEVIQWVGRMGANGVGEGVELDYWPDGTVKRERYYDLGNMQLRREVSFAADAHRRPTHAVTGSGTGAFATTAFWDRANNLAGLPSRKGGSPVFCGGPSTANPDRPANTTACIAMSHDLADRLQTVDEFINSTTQRQIQFDYDRHGGVQEVRSGCVPGTPCNDSPMKYVHDDFGNVVATELPVGAGGVNRTEYTALGRPAVKETPLMAGASQFLGYEYDQLGRMQKALRHVQGSQVSELLYEYFYDDSTAPPITCPAPLRSRKGRVAAKRDSFGYTWYDYGVLGGVVAEIRLRDGHSLCSSSSPDNNPHTFYSYNADGNLLSIDYPFGRRVEYQYGSDGSAHRPTGVNVWPWSGFLWDLTSPIEDVVWEPFGGLRGYRIKNGSAVLATIELMQGGVATTAPTNACTAAVPPGGGSDLTGRARALWVTSGHASYGSGAGNILRRFYTWNRDWLERTDTCRLNSGYPVVETYQYDESLRLTGAAKSGAGTSGSYEDLTWQYDLRGNIGSIGANAIGLTASYPTGVIRMPFKRSQVPPPASFTGTDTSTTPRGASLKRRGATGRESSRFRCTGSPSSPTAPRRVRRLTRYTEASMSMARCTSTSTMPKGGVA